MVLPTVLIAKGSTLGSRLYQWMLAWYNEHTSLKIICTIRDIGYPLYIAYHVTESGIFHMVPATYEYSSTTHIVESLDGKPALEDIHPIVAYFRKAWYIPVGYELDLPNNTVTICFRLFTNKD